jgi:hypothetical protein
MKDGRAEYVVQMGYYKCTLNSKEETHWRTQRKMCRLEAYKNLIQGNSRHYCEDMDWNDVIK